MAPNQPLTDDRLSRGSRLVGLMLPNFRTADLDDVRHAFQPATRCHMRQAWQPNESDHFAPAVVRVGWQQNVLYVYAELTDADIFTRASALNQRLWELGDAFEIFLRPDGQQAYVEFQVAPNNQRLQLRYANRAALQRARKTGSLSGALLTAPAFSSRVWIEDNPSRWHVLAEIPAAGVCGSSDTLAGQQWHFSFSRYDYTRGLDEPVISSTSPHARADFHSQTEWGLVRFARGAGSNGS